MIDFNSARKTYVCMFDIDDIDGYGWMSEVELVAVRLVEFTPEFLLKHCKERE